MLAVQNHLHKISFTKMSGASNDFIIIDARSKNIQLTAQQIQKISSRQNIGCDQLIILRNSSPNNSPNNLEIDCEMEIYNSDGSISGACGNATRCVAAILMQEKNSDKANIKTVAGILKSWRDADKEKISVDMGVAKFNWQEIPLSQECDAQNLDFFSMKFSCVNVGNPHAVTFLVEKIEDKKFFDFGPKIENHPLFQNKTNVEFARFVSENLVEVRVWERGAGETLACGTGACAVGIQAIKQGIVKGNKVITRFKGGDLEIQWNGENSSVIMTGGFTKIFDGEIDAHFLS